MGKKIKYNITHQPKHNKPSIIESLKFMQTSPITTRFTQSEVLAQQHNTTSHNQPVDTNLPLFFQHVQKIANRMPINNKEDRNLYFFSEMNL